MGCSKFFFLASFCDLMLLGFYNTVPPRNACTTKSLFPNRIEKGPLATVYITKTSQNIYKTPITSGLLNRLSPS
ncbi:hypothetical protein SAMN04487911_13411 [Arenibacter nanhaiticus]|uniref:Uncharacterized protein n=1 Tax=Arenibacter nanhaiticus TaxID=558155 RepID=A0A1M6LUP5_9FLAO|nr:hypothetical protein SAMN04487911_13411 [Arenibacter nanhaiticus]